MFFYKTSTTKIICTKISNNNSKNTCINSPPQATHNQSWLDYNSNILSPSISSLLSQPASNSILRAHTSRFILSHLSLFSLLHSSLRLIKYGFSSTRKRLLNKILSKHNLRLRVHILVSLCILNQIFRRILNMLNHLISMLNHLLLSTLSLNQEEPQSKTKV